LETNVDFFSLHHYRKKMKGIQWFQILLLPFITLLIPVHHCAQIIYTDIPDATPNASYPLDLNNDGSVDFIIQFGALDKIQCYPQDFNSYAGAIVGSNHLPYAMGSNSNICDSLSEWYGTDSPGIMAWNDTLGNWVNATERFLALRLNVNDQHYFGWARLSVMAGSTSFTVLDYAFESTPQQCLIAGSTSSIDLETKQTLNISVFPNPFSSIITMTTSKDLQNAIVVLINALGKTMLCETSLYGSSFTICANNLPAGIYFINLFQDNNHLFQEKIVITH